MCKLRFIHPYIFILILGFAPVNRVYSVKHTEDTAYIKLQEKVRKNFFSDGSRVKQDALKLIAMAHSRKDSAAFGEMYKILGIIHYFEGDYKQALLDYLKAVSYCKSTKNLREEAAVYNELGTLYRKHKRLDDALDIFNQAFLISKQLKDSSGMATALNNSGIVYEVNNQLDLALKQYSQALFLYQAINDRVGLSYCYENLGGIYLLKENYAQAEGPFLNSLQIRKEEKLLQASAMSYHYLGDLYFKQNRFPRAQKMYDSCLHISMAIRYPDLEQRAYSSLAELHKAQGRHQTALLYFEKASKLKDSLFNLEKDKALNELQTRYQVEKRRQENILLKQSIELSEQKNKSRNLKISLGMLLFLLLSGTVVYLLVRKQKTLKQQARKQVKEAENKQRKRISHELHDHVGAQLSYVVSNLEIAQEEINTQHGDVRRIKAITDMSKQAISTLRETVWALNQDKISNEAFADKFKLFAVKMAEAYPPIKLTFSEEFKTLEELPPNSALHVFRICQEAFTNALKHANGKSIQVHFSAGPAYLLEVLIQDDGRGMVNEEKKGHYGLKNMKSRAAEINAELVISSIPQEGTRIFIRLHKNTTYV